MELAISGFGLDGRANSSQFRRQMKLKMEEVNVREFTSRRILNNDKSWAKNAVNYVVSRQNADGGYTFWQGADSNAQDTYYGLAILKLLDCTPPNIGKTIEWLHGFELHNVYSYYYVGKTLALCGEKLDDHFQKYVSSTIASRSYLGSGDVYVEFASEFDAIYMVLELANLTEVDPTSKDATEWLLEFKNEDGGFGAHEHSNMNSTHSAVSSLHLVKYNIESLQDTAAFIRACEKPYGGFTVIPHAYEPYMEYTYYGTMALHVFKQDCRFPSQTVDFLLRCQNANGGFARADLGVSSFESTFQAVSVMHNLA